jgi:hypothetical protein
MSSHLRRFLPSVLVLGLVLLPSALAAQAVPIGVNELRSGSLATGDTARFSFEAGDDFLLYGEVNQISVDVVVTLTDPEGRRVGPAWDGPARGSEAFSTTIPTAGIYTLHVAPFQQEEGDFELQILQLEARADDPERLADQLMFPYARPGGPGGAIQVWRGGRTVFSRAYGLADLTHAIPFRTPPPPTSVRHRSISRPLPSFFRPRRGSSPSTTTSAITFPSSRRSTRSSPSVTSSPIRRGFGSS